MIPAGSAGGLGRVDDDLGAVEGRLQPAAGNDVHPGSTRHGHDLVAALGENLGDVPAEPSGRAGNCDLHDVLLRDDFRFTGTTEHGPMR
jgi:hypothetical protein